MNKLQRFGISLFALTFGCFILGISLIMTSQVLSSGNQPMSSRKFYFASEVMPDHVLYPLFMTFDRVRLETATPEEQVLLELVYAQRRFEHGLELLESGDEALAVTTLSKAQKYLISAAQRAQLTDLSDTQRTKVYEIIMIQSKQLEQAAQTCTDTNATVLNRLIDDTRLVARTLQ